MKTYNLLTNPMFGLVVTIFIGALVFSCTDNEGTETLPPEKTFGYKVESAEQLTPFGMENLQLIKGKKLHVVHFEDGQSCGSCHVDKDEIDETLAVSGCIDCHDELQTHGNHQNHCTVCHDFSANETSIVDETRPIEFCQKCHNESDVSGYVQSFFEHKMKAEMGCSSCHQPHLQPRVFATNNCSNCHGQFLNNPLVKQGHQSCTTCHEPHTWTVDNEEFSCTTCHSAPSSVLEHNIGSHPDDCIECHSPHFYDRSIEGGKCSSCHEEKNYSQGHNLPAEHKNCGNCHKMSSWSFKGSSSCAGCHLDPGAVISNETAPDEHKRCLNCHREHTWKTTYERTCNRCHEMDGVNEHLVEFHNDDCSACHDPHLTFNPPETGDCSACHADAIPNFKPASPAMHMDCVNCHTEESVELREFEFAGEVDSCMVCHAQAVEPDSAVDGDTGVSWDDAPAGHVMCTGCHQDHSWEPRIGKSSCGVCHADTWSDVSGNLSHAVCSNCHTSSHLMEFAGTESSCALCHSEVAEQVGQVGKDDCTMCHAQHTFETDQSACITCHSERPETHQSSGHQDCSVCHEMHNFVVNLESCLVCHTDRSEHFPGVDCTKCHKFRD